MTTPSMSGADSYLALPALTNTHHELRLDVEFKPLDPDGILLFSGGKSGPVEDFVSLAMVGGHLEFRYELGSGKQWVPCVTELLVSSLGHYVARRREEVGSGTRPLTSVVEHVSVKHVSVTLRPPRTTKSSEIPQSCENCLVDHILE